MESESVDTELTAWLASGMSATPPHSAAGSAAGYLHQMQVALLELWDRTPEDPGVTVSVESLDDITIADAAGDPVILVQSKHHLADSSLTDRSPDLWRTLAVWSDYISHNGAADLPRLALYTTAACSQGSAVELLRPRVLSSANRDPQTARASLEVVAAETPGNKETTKARAAFLALTDDERSALVEAMDVFDQGAQIGDFGDQLRTAIGMHAPDPEAVKEFAERLVGWWIGQVVFMLVGEITSISGHELWAFVTELSDNVGRRKLVVDEALMLSEPKADEKSDLFLRTFVRQLQLITDESALFNIAVIDYWRARTQRVRWERNGDVTPDAMVTYDRRLRSEWQNAHAIMCARINAAADSDGRRAAGLGLYDELPQRATARIRPDFHEPVITRGSLHALADRRDIGWHPDFESLLDLG